MCVCIVHDCICSDIYSRCENVCGRKFTLVDGWISEKYKMKILLPWDHFLVKVCQVFLRHEAETHTENTHTHTHTQRLEGDKLASWIERLFNQEVTGSIFATAEVSLDTAMKSYRLTHEPLWGTASAPKCNMHRHFWSNSVITGKY